MRGLLWADSSAEPPPTTEPLAGEAACAVAVIGGGFTGLSTALHLAGQGSDCRLLEAGRVGAGASGRNNGQVIPGLKLGPAALRERYGDAGAAVVETAAGAADLVFDLIDRHAIACEPERRGWLRAAQSAPALRQVEALARDLQAQGAPVALLDAEETAAALGSPAYLGGLIDRRAGRLQPLAYCRGLARAAQAAGANLHEESPVQSLERQGERWILRTPQGVLRAEAVVMAVGAYGERLWPGWSRGFITVQSMQIASAPLSSNLRAAVLPGASAMSDSRKLATALRLDAEGRLCIAGRGPLNGRMGPGVHRQLQRNALRLFPALADTQWTHAWPGRIAVTLDALPRLTSPAPGLYAIVGFNGRGVAMATALGKAAAEHLLGRPAGFPLVPAPPVPLHRLRRPLLAAAIAYYRLRDAAGLASN
ncbi:MAG: FAD-binding oxidoreductase [Rhodospirillales bacterium]